MARIDERFKVAKKRVVDVKGKDRKRAPKAKWKPIIKKDTIGFKVKKKF